MNPTEALQSLGITVDVVSGPTPHNADGWQGIEFAVSVKRNGKEFLATPYRLGIGHIDLTKADPDSVWAWKAGMDATETNFLRTWKRKPYANFTDKDLQTSVACKLAKVQKVQPKAEDVLWSLVSDSDVLDYPTFEDWASNLGMDTDSRKAESTYRACLEIALKLRNTVGEAGMETLRNAFQDY